MTPKLLLGAILAVSMGVSDAPNVQPSNIQPIAIPTPIEEPVVDQHELECLQMNIYYEARGEGIRGMQAVAVVTVNRAMDARWPDTVCAVVKQKRGQVCQFSWVCKFGAVKPKRPDFESWTIAETIARQALTGDLRSPVGDATHFHTHAVRPSWAKRLHYIATIGGHIFYK